MSDILSDPSSLPLIVVSFSAGIIISVIIITIISRARISSAKSKAHEIISDAQKQADLKIKMAELDAKDEWFKIKNDFEKEMEAVRKSIEKDRNAVAAKDEDLNRKINFLNKKEGELSKKIISLEDKERHIQKRNLDVERLIGEQNEKLLRIANMSQEEAKAMLFANLENQVRHESAQHLKKIRDQAKEKADEEAKRIVTIAIQRCAAEHSVDTTVSSLMLESDEIKGKIIGREGRNIRTFEEQTGVDVIVDDTPGTVILSAFDPIKREVARSALEKLIADGRIHPARIEEIVSKTQKEIEKKIKEVGEQTTLEMGIHNIHPQLINYLGRLHFRTSFGQNVLKHSKEVALLSELMSAELRLDTNVAKRAALLHDIGKAIDRQVEGTHAELGGAVAKKYGENEIICNAIAGHHEDVEPISCFPILIQAADAISATRPGARMETISAYVKRVEKLEEIAESFRGVGKAFALQAGREIRVMVEPEELDDLQAEELARQISKKIENEMDYPGQIKVTIIREKRIIGFAK